MDYSKTKGIEIDLSAQEEYEFKFHIDVAATVVIKGGRARWNIEVMPKIPKPPGRPKKETVSGTVPFKFVRASELQQVYEPDGVEEFLKSALKNGPRYSGEIFEETSKIGWSRGSVFRAAKKLDIYKHPTGHGKALRWMWELKNDKQTNVAHGDSGPESTLDAAITEKAIPVRGDSVGDGGQ